MSVSSPIQIRLGAMTAWFSNGAIRYVRVYEHEIVRAIFPTCRDPKWGSVLPKIHDLSTNITDSVATLNYGVDFSDDRIGIDARIKVNMKWVDNRLAIDFEFVATAWHPSWMNRLGLCVLHPPKFTENYVWTVTQTSGKIVSRKVRPTICPQALFSGIRTLCHPTDGTVIRFDFSGEEFETEDQRNWCDASIKTYCRPLVKPRPYVLEPDREIKQSCSIHCQVPDNSSTSRFIEPSYPEFRQPAKIPLIGLCLRDTLRQADLDALKRLSPDFLRYDWSTKDKGCLQDLDQIGYPIELCLHVDHVDQLPKVQDLPSCVERIFVFRNRLSVSDESLIKAAHERYPDRQIGGGTIGNFAELNRHRPSREGRWSSATYAVCMQVHATDDWSLMENLPALRDGVRTARSFLDGRWLSVGPIVLYQQPDPFAAGNDGAVIPAVEEPRTYLPMSACWTVGVLTNLLLDPPDAAIVFDLNGVNGLVGRCQKLSPALAVLESFFAWRRSGLLVWEDPESPFRSAGFATVDGPMWLANTGFQVLDLSLLGLGKQILPPHSAVLVHREKE